MATPEEPSTGALAQQNDSLWREAFCKFKVDDTELYDALQELVRKDQDIDQELPLESQLGSILARKQQVMRDKRWVFYWRKKEVSVRSQFDKIVQVLQVIKPIGDAAATLDPIHAGIPWACISMLLPVSLP